LLCIGKAMNGSFKRAPWRHFAFRDLSGVVRRISMRALCAGPRLQRGMTLLELLLALVMTAILLSLGYAGYRQVVERMRISRTIADLSDIQLALDKFELNTGALPSSLNDVGLAAMLDPWGGTYRYLNIAEAIGPGAVRKDRNLVPINTDYDLYSMGRDGQSQPPLTAATSRDDIVRANDGRFVGKAEDY
jgi:general secretion pathway protein G